MPLYQISDSRQLKQIPAAAFPKEIQLQKLFEANLPTLLGASYIASEFSTGLQQPGRIDTLALDEDGSPVIIEYKKTRNDSIINQGLFYLNWLVDHKGDFTLAAEKTLGKGVEIDWSRPRLVLIAESFSTYDKFAVNQISTNIELWTYRLYGKDLFYLESINNIPTKVKTSIKPTAEAAPEPAVSEEKEIEEPIFETEYHLAGKNNRIRELFYEFQERIASLDPDNSIIEKVNKNIISYKHGKNFCEVWVQSSKLKLWLDISLADLQDPLGLAEDVSEKGHWGTGDTVVNLVSLEDLDPVMDLVSQAFQLTL